MATPLGPGFFIFFQSKPIDEKLSKDRGISTIDTRIKEDDEILLFIQMAVTHRLL